MVQQAIPKTFYCYAILVLVGYALDQKACQLIRDHVPNQRKISFRHFYPQHHVQLKAKSFT
jgi:hypothetical protein